MKENGKTFQISDCGMLQIQVSELLFSFHQQYSLSLLWLERENKISTYG